jgi:hypothetical protein
MRVISQSNCEVFVATSAAHKLGTIAKPAGNSAYLPQPYISIRTTKPYFV